MRLIVIGFLFILFNYSVILDDTVIGLVPSFLGYALLYRTINELKSHFDSVHSVKILLYAMTFFTTIQYSLALLGMNMRVPDLAPALSIIGVVGYFTLGTYIFKALSRFEDESGRSVDAGKLGSTLIAVAICDAGMYASYWMPSAETAAFMLSMGTKIIFLARLLMLKGKYMYVQRELHKKAASTASVVPESAEIADENPPEPPIC